MQDPVLPTASEKNYPSESKFCQAAGDIAFRLNQEKQIVTEIASKMASFTEPFIIREAIHFLDARVLPGEP